MIIALFGQPGSGKSTIAKQLQRTLFIDEMVPYPVVDGDEIREIFKNKDYSKEGRLNNLARISEISTFLAHQYNNVIISAVYPIKEAREYLESLYKEVIWVYLTYDGERGREGYHVTDFDYPTGSETNLITINTSNNAVEQCTQAICAFYRSLSKPA